MQELPVQISDLPAFLGCADVSSFRTRSRGAAPAAGGGWARWLRFPQGAGGLSLPIKHRQLLLFGQTLVFYWFSFTYKLCDPAHTFLLCSQDSILYALKNFDDLCSGMDHGLPNRLHQDLSTSQQAPNA